MGNGDPATIQIVLSGSLQDVNNLIDVSHSELCDFGDAPLFCMFHEETQHVRSINGFATDFSLHGVRPGPSDLQMSVHPSLSSVFDFFFKIPSICFGGAGAREWKSTDLSTCLCLSSILLGVGCGHDQITHCGHKVEPTISWPVNFAPTASMIKRADSASAPTLTFIFDWRTESPVWTKCLN